MTPMKQNLVAGCALLFLTVAGVAGALNGPVPIDFEVYTTAGHDLLAGRDPYVLREMPFVYPPSALWLMAPFGLVTPQVGGAIWAAMLWAMVAFAAVRWTRHLGVTFSASSAVLAILFFYPAHRALDPLNIEIALFFVASLCAPYAKPPRLLVDAVLGFVAGFVATLKPHWLMIVGPTLFLQRRYAAVAGAIAGTATMVLSSMQSEHWASYLRNIQWEVGYRWTVDVWRAGPELGLLCVALWCVAVLILWRRNPPHAWLFALTAVVVWPRIAAYSYVLAFPLIVYLFLSLPSSLRAPARWLPVIVFSAPFGYVGVLLELHNGALTLNYGYSWRGVALGVIHWASLIAMMGVLWREQWRSSKSDDL